MKRINVFISIGIISSIILCTIFGLLIFYNGENPKNTHIEYFVSSCQGDKPLAINISIVDKSIFFHQIISSYCDPPLTNPNNFKIEVFLYNNLIMVYETFTTEEGVSRCLCSFGINGTISAIPFGSLKLLFIENNQYVRQIYILEEFEINI